MRHGITLVLALLSAAMPAAAQSTIQRTITVTGQAEIKVAPDEVLLSIGVETDNLDIARARADNDARVKAVVAAATRTRWSPYSSWWGNRGDGMVQNVMQDRRASGSDESLVPGQISVTAGVSVTFELGSGGR